MGRQSLMALLFLYGSVGYVFEDIMAMLKTFAKKGSHSGDILEHGILRVWRRFDS